MHDELQADKVELPPSPAPNKPQIAAPFGEDETPKCSRHLRDFGKSKTPGTRRQWGLAAKGYEAKDQAIAQRDARIASLEEELARLQRGKKKKSVTNPNKRFMRVVELDWIGLVVFNAQGRAREGPAQPPEGHGAC